MNPTQIELNQHTSARIAAILAQLDAVKPLYSELDALVLELGPGTYGTIEVVDNFAERNTVFRPAGVRRFEARPVKPQKPN